MFFCTFVVGFKKWDASHPIKTKSSMSKKILFINQEITPYVPETEMSLMGYNVPLNIQEAGYEIRTFMPKWGNINERRGQLHEVIRLSGVNLIIDETDHPLIIKVASIPSTRIQVYFIDNDDYFMKRQMALDESGMPYSDNGQRAIFFARGVLETVKKLRWNPDIIHCQGWMAAYIPVLIKKAFKDEPAFANTKVVTTLFNHGLEGQLGNNFKKTLEYKSIKAATLSEFNAEFDYNELEKLAIAFSDGVIEGGEGIKQELLDYADKKGVPVLKYPGQDFTESYKKFYDTVYPEK